MTKLQKLSENNKKYITKTNANTKKQKRSILSADSIDLKLHYYYYNKIVDASRSAVAKLIDMRIVLKTVFWIPYHYSILVA